MYKVEGKSRFSITMDDDIKREIEIFSKEMGISLSHSISVLCKYQLEIYKAIKEKYDN